MSVLCCITIEINDLLRNLLFCLLQKLCLLDAHLRYHPDKAL